MLVHRLAELAVGGGPDVEVLDVDPVVLAAHVQQPLPARDGEEDERDADDRCQRDRRRGAAARGGSTKHGSTHEQRSLAARTVAEPCIEEEVRMPSPPAPLPTVGEG